MKYIDLLMGDYTFLFSSQFSLTVTAEAVKSSWEIRVTLTSMSKEDPHRYEYNYSTVCGCHIKKLIVS